MALTDIDFSPPEIELPKSVATYLAQMEPRVEEFRSKTPGAFRGFVPSDYAAFYGALAHVVDRRLACGHLFCEWGSGLGVAACLASILGFDAQGIEIDERLFHASRKFADELGQPVQFVHGSFLPADVDDLVDEAYVENDGWSSMFAHSDDAYTRMGLDLEDFDLIFVFPWPDDEEVTARMFERFASTGALLLTYHDVDSMFRLRRK